MTAHRGSLLLAAVCAAAAPLPCYAFVNYSALLAPRPLISAANAVEKYQKVSSATRSTVLPPNINSDNKYYTAGKHAHTVMLDSEMSCTSSRRPGPAGGTTQRCTAGESKGADDSVTRSGLLVTGIKGLATAAAAAAVGVTGSVSCVATAAAGEDVRDPQITSKAFIEVREEWEPCQTMRAAARS